MRTNFDFVNKNFFFQKKENIFAQNVSNPQQEDFACNHSFYPHTSNFNSQIDFIELDDEEVKSDEEFHVSRNTNNQIAYDDEYAHNTYKHEMISCSDDDSNKYRRMSDKREAYDFNNNNNNKVNKYNKWDEREVCF
jgi:hypothetical protein